MHCDTGNSKRVDSIMHYVCAGDRVPGWSAILSRRSLRACNEKLRAACSTCRQLSDAAVPCVVSACVVSTELHPNIHIMIDAVKPDDNQRARRPMSTPTDSSCTHILVFPTSATAQVGPTVTCTCLVCVFRIAHAMYYWIVIVCYIWACLYHYLVILSFIFFRSHYTLS